MTFMYKSTVNRDLFIFIFNMFTFSAAQAKTIALVESRNQGDDVKVASVKTELATGLRCSLCLMTFKKLGEKATPNVTKGFV